MPVFGVRESRRSESAICRGSSVVGSRSLRGVNCENNIPHVKPCGTGANGRMSPRLGVYSGSGSRPLYAYAAARHPGADITNVTGARYSQVGQLDKVKNSRQSLSLQEASTTSVEVSSHEERFIAVITESIDKSNVQNAAEYLPDIYNHMFQEEANFLPRPDYMDAQTDITAKMRAILIDWLIEVHMKYRLCPETLHLAVNLIDRYCSRMPVLRKRLQLVGVVAMFIAAKYEEINPPELRDWVYITDNAYTKDDVLTMECTMLTTISFHIAVPTAVLFFEGLQAANHCDEVHRSIAQYILELGLLDIRMLRYTPSLVCSAALLLSNELLGRCPVWPSCMEKFSRHTEPALRECMEDFRALLQVEQAGSNQLHSVRKKFAAPQRHSVAEMTF